MTFWEIGAVASVALAVAALVLRLVGERRAAKFFVAFAAGGLVAFGGMAAAGEVRHSTCVDTVERNLRTMGVGGYFLGTYHGPVLNDCDDLLRRPWASF